MIRPIIALTGIDTDDPPQWLASIQNSLNEAYELRLYTKAALVSQLADDYVALILVDGDQPDWVYWTATPSSSPATRRIPIFLIATDAATRTRSITSGADRAFSPDEFVADWQVLLAEYARVFDLERTQQLDCECLEPLPLLAQQGLAQFNAGEFYKQHDSFEELWMATDGPVRDLYRAILQVGVAYYQILRGNHRGALKMLLRSVQWLTILPDVCQGIDVAALKADSYRVRAALETLPEDEIDQFDRSLLQPLKTVSRS
jgi:predicted metal-dependent hydrolase